MSRFARHVVQKIPTLYVLLLILFLSALACSSASAFTLNVVDPNGAPVSGFRWLVEEDNTNLTIPHAPVADSISLDIHNSYAPVVAKGHFAGAGTVVNVPADKRYFVTVLPDSGYAMNGRPVPKAGDPDYVSDTITVVVHPMPLPTAQISIFAFVDQNPINNAWDEHEEGLGGCTVVLHDMGGQMMQDAFGNPLGTTYQQNPDGTFVLDGAGNPVIDVIGNGVITTLTKEDFDLGNNPYNLKVGEALIKFIPPGKYGVVIVPPGADDNGVPIKWVQTTTIEGTPTIDAWVKADEPKLFVEGFGVGFNHVFMGFVKEAPTTDSPWKGQVISALPWNQTPPAGTGTIRGTLRLNHLSRPPATQGFFAGPPVKEGWIGLNDPTAKPGVQPAGLFATACDPDTGDFVINNVPAGTYQLVRWDRPLDYLFGFSTVTVGPGEVVDLGDVFMFRWFGTLENYVFLDSNENGFRDPGETGLAGQTINIRFRDGTIYQTLPTDLDGYIPFEEVFPFFKWLVVEVDFARFKATGMTTAVDYGGQIPGPQWPADGNKNPQPQQPSVDNPPGAPYAGAPYRTETGPVLTQAMQLFLSQTNLIEWGKNVYGPGENGGITGIVFYAVTRAEDDPRYAVGEPWERGIPRVQVNLYKDSDANGVIDDLDGDGLPTLADVDNYPFGWRNGGPKGPEDIDRNADSLFDPGDAIQITTTDSWDDNKPTGCVQDLPVIHGQVINECADAFGTWNQVRPGVFDGGYAFDSYFPGGIASGSAEVNGLPADTYIVEAVTPPYYELVKEEDKNVDFGVAWTPSQLLLPPVCVGDPHVVPAELSLFPGIAAPFAGQTRPLCDRKQIALTDGKNAATDFFVFTEVPKAARAVGFVNNDLAAEFNTNSPNFGEKPGTPWIPVSFKDWTGREIVRVYTDEFGGYNALLPSTFTVNVGAPTGVSPNMITLVLNDPLLPDGTVDPFYNPIYSVTPWTLQYMPGTTTYLDTPLVPLAAFAAAEVKLDTEPTDGTPVINSVTGPEIEGGPLFCTDRSSLPGTLTITSSGPTQVPNPAYDPAVPGSPVTLTRDFGFGATQGVVTLNGAPLDVVSWTDGTVTATVPPGAATGQLMVTRGDNGKTTEIGITVHIVDCSGLTVHSVTNPGSIQAAIDAANPGDIIVVGPGNYNENVIMNKPVRLQGSGAGTRIFANPTAPVDRLQTWRDRVLLPPPQGLGGSDFAAFLLKNPLSENEAPGIIVMGETPYPTGNLQLPGPDPNANLFNPGFPFDTPGQAMIDGFTISGATNGGGIFAMSRTSHLVISNNHITNNQGEYAGGISVGIQDAGFPGQFNDNVVIRYNKIDKNSGTQGAGGVSMNEYSNDYLVADNLIFGNLSRFNGAGISHRGLSLGTNVIRNNRILFNENFYGALLNKAGDGGGIYVGGDVAGGTGSGSVTIEGNLIQGNLTGSGSGGGIYAFAVNAQDVRDFPADPAQWYELNIFNNIIVNNVAALAGGGICLQDVAKANIINNTIANNDSTATSILAFSTGQLNVSNPQPAGVVSRAHSDILVGLFWPSLAQTYSDPVLVNNIIWHNRSYYNDASLNGGAGGLLPNPAGLYQDLGVIGTVTPESLNPMNCLLTDPAGFDPSNVTGDPAFVLGYSNNLRSASVLDEGGNFINILFDPLDPAAGDYHIQAGSAAIDAGSSAYLASVPTDYDAGIRPAGSGVDIGADEFGAATVGIMKLITGTVTVNHNWTTVILPQAYTNPVVIAKPLSKNGGDPAVVRIRNVTGNSFQIRVQEWNYLDQWHLMENVSYMVMEAGHYVLANGLHVEAGTVTTNKANANNPFEAVSFASTFPVAGPMPVVATAVMTYNGHDTVATRNRNIGKTGFETVMQEQEGQDHVHVTETLGYVAWEPGTGTIDTMTYEVGSGGTFFNHQFKALNHGIASPTALIMDMQTTNGRDTANLRYTGPLAGPQVQVSEETSKDSEKLHISEEIGYFVFQ